MAMNNYKETSYYKSKIEQRDRMLGYAKYYRSLGWDEKANAYLLKSREVQEFLDWLDEKAIKK